MVAMNESKNLRGLHIVIINPDTGEIERAKAFDTYKSSRMIMEFMTEMFELRYRGYIIAAACMDDCAKQLDHRCIKEFL